MLWLVALWWEAAGRRRGRRAGRLCCPPSRACAWAAANLQTGSAPRCCCFLPVVPSLDRFQKITRKKNSGQPDLNQRPKDISFTNYSPPLLPTELCPGDRSSTFSCSFMEQKSTTTTNRCMNDKARLAMCQVASADLLLLTECVCLCLFVVVDAWYPFLLRSRQEATRGCPVCRP